MSYNITSLNVKELSLTLPVTFNFREWIGTQPEWDERGLENYAVRDCKEDTAITITCDGEKWELEIWESSLSGTIRSKGLQVSTLECSGEFSGHIFTEIILPLFTEFQGTLVAMIVWEGGDTIEHLTLRNGSVLEDKND